MKFSKIKDVLNLSDEELTNEIINGKKQLFGLRLNQATRQAFKPHSFRYIKHRLSQLLMVQHMRRTQSKLKD